MCPLERKSRVFGQLNRDLKLLVEIEHLPTSNNRSGALQNHSKYG